jgi:hypothetical protein
LPADQRIRTGLEDPTTEAAARNEASVHAYVWQAVRIRWRTTSTLHAGRQAPNAVLSGKHPQLDVAA